MNNMQKSTIILLSLPLFLAGCSNTPEVKKEPAEPVAKQAPPTPLVLEWVTVKAKPKCEANVIKRKDAVKFTWSGSCKSGKVHGKGKLEMFDEANKRIHKFEGTMKDGMANGDGKGESIDAEGKVTKGVGIYVNGLRNGPGYTEWSDGTKFETEYKDGISTGKGKISYANGGWYEGEFVAGKRVGNGTLRYKNDNEFTGTFVDGSPSTGTFRWADGTSQQGKFSGDSWVGTGQVRKPTINDLVVFDSKFGMFLHKKTNLTWRRCAMGRKWDEKESKCTGTEARASWGEMVALANKEKYAGFSDWRLPSVDEYAALFPGETLQDCRKLEVAIPKLFPNIYNQYLFGSNHWLANNSDDLMKPVSANMEPTSMALICRFAATEIRPHGKQPAMLVRGGSIPKEWTKALASQKLTAKINANSKASADKYWDPILSPPTRTTSGGGSATGSTSTSSYCGSSDTCFEVISNYKDEISIKCTKGATYRIGQTVKICGPNSKGKYASGCGITHSAAYHYDMRKAGNIACE